MSGILIFALGQCENASKRRNSFKLICSLVSALNDMVHYLLKSITRWEQRTDDGAMKLTNRTFDGGAFGAINWIYSSYNRAKPYIQRGMDKETRHPEWTGRLLKALGDLDAPMYNIAVTGSKGKGSHSILIAAMLEQMGFRVGLFTGPHLVDFMERFRVNGQVMAERQFARYVDDLRETVDNWDLPENEYFGPVGLLAAIAVKWFSDTKTDINVFELGRGALHDDVNQVRHVGAVIAPVFLEHTRELGRTYAEVGTEKAGVITKDTRWVCTHPQTATVQGILAERSSDDIELSTLGDTIAVRDRQVEGLTCIITVETKYGECQVRLPYAQIHLADNVAVALSAAQHAALDKHPDMVLPAYLDLQELSLPGRLQTVSIEPRVVVDGTIHGRSAALVREYIRNRRQETDSGERITGRVGAIIGIPEDKDGTGVLKVLSDVVDFVVICRAHNPHLQFDDNWTRLARTLYADVSTAQYLEDALVCARERLSSEADLLLVLGTQSLVGDAMRLFEFDTRSIWRRAPLKVSKR